jgi:hypothetical protein
VNAGPRDANWKDRLKVITNIQLITFTCSPRFVATAFSEETLSLSYGSDSLNTQEEYTALIKYIQLGKENDTDWFQIESNKEVRFALLCRL